MIIARPFIRELVKHSPFDCGKPSLRTWLKEQAGQKERRDASRTWLAIDRDYQSSGLGKLLLFDALQRVEQASYDIGFELIVVEALHEDAACFYLKYGGKLPTTMKRPS